MVVGHSYISRHIFQWRFLSDLKTKPNYLQKSLRAHNSPKVCFVSPIICSTWYNICEECLSLSIKSCSDNDSLMTFGMVLYLVLFPPRVLSYCLLSKSCLGHMSHYNMIIIWLKLLLPVIPSNTMRWPGKLLRNTPYIAKGIINSRTSI